MTVHWIAILVIVQILKQLVKESSKIPLVFVYVRPFGIIH